MSDYDPNRAERASESRRRWTWIIGLVALAVVIGVIYAMSNHGGAPASTAQAPAPAAPGGAGRR
jgi:hypothetical protein